MVSLRLKGYHPSISSASPRGTKCFGSNLEPSTWEKQAKPSTPTADVRLIPRDDRDLGFDDGPDDAGTGQPDARGAMQVDDDNAAGDKPERADHGRLPFAHGGVRQRPNHLRHMRLRAIVSG